MNIMAAAFAGFEPKAYFNAFHSLGTHYSLCQHSVDFSVPVNVASQAGRQSGYNNLIDTPEGSPFLSPQFNFFAHFITKVTVQCPHIRFVRFFKESLSAVVDVWGGLGSDFI